MKKSVILWQILQIIQTILIKLPTKKSPLQNLLLWSLLVLLVFLAVVMLIVCCLIYVPFLAVSEAYKKISESYVFYKFSKKVLKI